MTARVLEIMEKLAVLDAYPPALRIEAVKRLVSFCEQAALTPLDELVGNIEDHILAQADPPANDFYAELHRALGERLHNEILAAAAEC